VLLNLEKIYKDRPTGPGNQGPGNQGPGNQGPGNQYDELVFAQ